MLIFPVYSGPVKGVTVSEALGYSEHTTATAEDERWALVHRIVSSRHLLKAPQLREIFLFLARRALNDNATAISEQEIGCKVLGRRADFNPNEDNIVRVQVRRLRGKLDEYFSEEGSGEALLVSIPKGAYLLSFETRSAPPAIPGGITAPVSASTASAGWFPKTRVPILLLMLLAAGLGVCTLILWKQREAAPHAPSADESPSRRTDPIWSRIFVPGRQTDIVVADSCLVAMQDILDVDIPLHEYASGVYREKLIQSAPGKELQAALRLIADRQYTSLGDANLGAKFIELSRRYGAQTNIRYPRFMSARDFRSGSFILIGSRRGIPWEQLFEPQLNFALEEDRSLRKFFFRNKAPLPGEQATYTVSGAGGPTAYTYADIALLPNLGGAGPVLILAGIDMAATEAAGELLVSPDFADVVSHILRSGKGQPPSPYIEILVEEKSAGGTAGSKIVAHRLLARQKPA